MVNRGIDTDTSITPEVGCIKSAGYSFICRYINRAAKVEIDHIRSQGVYVVSIFEENPNYYGYFSGPRGTADGIMAVNHAKILGQPTRTPIYFAVDFDASLEQIQGEILVYFESVRAQLIPHSYEVGVYGSGLVLDTLTDKGIVEYGWLSMSGAWRGSAADKDWNIHQIGAGYACGISVDYNVTTGNGGGWK